MIPLISLPIQQDDSSYTRLTHIFWLLHILRPYLMAHNEYTLIRSTRRSLSLQISKTGEVIVRAPLRYSVEKIDIFFHEKSRWIEKNLAKIKEQNAQKEADKWYYFLFSERLIQREKTENEIIQLSKESLRKYIDKRLSEMLSGMSFKRTIANIRINSARTRWGSCSSKGTLSFSYRLVSYPKETIDAVIIHELAHLTHANHSRKFWDLVYSILPDYEARVKILKNISPGGEIE